MGIFKAKVEDNYTVIPNKTIQDVSLSAESKGVLTFLLSLPSDWEIHKIWLVKQFANCGRDKLNRIMGELKDAGYIKKVVKRNTNGTLDGFDWFVYPTSTVSLVNRTTENPCDGKPTTTKETVIQKKHNTNILRDESLNEGFEIFYQSGLVKKSKQKAKQAFTKIVKKDKCNPIELAELLRQDIQTKLLNNEFGFNKLHPSTYLNNERWTDETNNNGFTTSNGKKSASDRVTERNNFKYGYSSSGLVVAEDDRNIRGVVDKRTRGNTIERVEYMPIES